MSTRFKRLLRTSVIVAAVGACERSPTMSGKPVGNAEFVATSDQLTQTHFIANGVNGGVSWFSSDPSGSFTYGSLLVTTTDTLAPSGTAYLSYYETQCDATYNCSSSYGYGTIPKADVRSSGLSATDLHLNTNTSDNPSFVTSNPGVVTVDWHANGIYTSSFTGVSTNTSAGFTQKVQGTSKGGSATVTGDIAGTPIPLSAEGSIGSSHNLSITITH